MRYYILLAVVLLAVTFAALSIVYAWTAEPAEGALVTILWLMLIALIISEETNR